LSTKGCCCANTCTPEVKCANRMVGTTMVCVQVLKGFSKRMLLHSLQASQRIAHPPHSQTTTKHQPSCCTALPPRTQTHQH
jgi:hypothetical protein